MCSFSPVIFLPDPDSLRRAFIIVINATTISISHAVTCCGSSYTAITQGYEEEADRKCHDDFIHMSILERLGRESKVFRLNSF